MGIKLSGFKEFISAFNARRVRSVANEELRKKVKTQLVLLRGDIDKYIKSEKHGIPNSPLTILVKGSSRPLVDGGDLRQSINVRVKTEGADVVGGVGVLRTKTSRDGKKLWNIGRALHEGFKVRVTARVRAAVFAEMRKRSGGKVKFVSEGGESASVWHVKGRPFIKDPLDEASNRIIDALGEGVRITLEKL